MFSYVRVNGGLRDATGLVHEQLVLTALESLLRKRGLEPLNGWLVHKVHSLYMDTNYIIVIGYPKAKAVVRKELDLITDQVESIKSGVGIWVLAEPEAKRLCERNTSTPMTHIRSPLRATPPKSVA